VALAVIATGSAFGASVASATTRYVTPNPAPGADCLSPATACALNASTSNGGPGDELVVLPGDYMVGTEQLNSLNSGDVHGVAGQPRPRIFSTYEFSAWTVGSFGTPPTITFRHIEIHTTGSSGISVTGLGATTVEDVVATATGGPSAGCAPAAGTGSTITIKNTICRGVNRGIGSTCAGCNSTSITLRNVTAIGDTYGIAFEAAAGGSTSDFPVSATNVIARHTTGTGADVRAQAGSTNSDVVITLANSNYETEEEALCTTPPCTATVTNPGSGTNQTTAPAFVDVAGGDFHQALGSPTINAGTNDLANGTTDIDGQDRQIDGTTDIGADELGIQTSLSVDCSPSTFVLPGSSVCTATATDSSTVPTSPTGQVQFAANGPGQFSTGQSCALSDSGPGQSGCSVAYVPGAPGTQTITGTSSRDVVHDGSSGTAQVTASAAPITATPLPPPPFTTQATRKKKCKKGFRLKKVKTKSGAIKKKCIRKKKRRT
jgi:hypothetical protein